MVQLARLYFDSFSTTLAFPEPKIELSSIFFYFDVMND